MKPLGGLPGDMDPNLKHANSVRVVVDTTVNKNNAKMSKEKIVKQPTPVAAFPVSKANKRRLNEQATIALNSLDKAFQAKVLCWDAKENNPIQHLNNFMGVCAQLRTAQNFRWNYEVVNVHTFPYRDG
ncbi:hypothetical protein KY284_024904 [Solanum tuberosum]|nr:hypothetical protein KY284_024904 [Solanum tuberosum]